MRSVLMQHCPTSVVLPVNNVVLVLLVVAATMLAISLATCATHTLVGTPQPKSGKTLATVVAPISASLHISASTANVMVTQYMNGLSVPHTLECFPLVALLLVADT